jgi:nucleoside-diphosphate-sugar epimerase/predicted dehydrogenase
MTKVGMLGAGFILASHAKSVAALPGLELAVIGDAAASRAEAAAKLHGFTHAVTSIEAMAASDCDVVHILLPPTLHAQAALAMIRAGKSVLIEKPYVLDGAEAEALVQAAEQAGVAIGVNHNFLFGSNYQRLRDLVRTGGLGRIDDLRVDWHYQLPFIKHGPFDNWIVSAPANPLFEIGAHPIAFALDLLGGLTLDHVEASDFVTLPSGIIVPQRWRILGRGPQGSAVTLSLAFTPGHESRALVARGTGGAIRYDFGRDIGLVERTRTDNPMLDAHKVAKDTLTQLKAQAGPDLRRRVRHALAKHPAATPFDECIFNSIRAFYEGRASGTTDPRHAASFGGETVRLAGEIAAKAGQGEPSRAPISVTLPEPAKPSDVLVVGGTGFIGRALVKRLLSEGRGVRVMTRGARGAALAMRGLPVEIFAGHHGDPAALESALAGIKTVYHLAKAEGRRWQDYVEGDITPTKALGEAAAKAGVERLIYTGTIDSYDSASAANSIDNTTPVDRRIAGRNLYARSKAACEAALREIAARTGLKLVIMRPGIVIGAGSPPAHLGVGRFTSDTQVDFWGDGTNMLPFVHVDDVADALARAATAPGIDGQDFLISGPPLLSARDYVSALEQAAGTTIEAKPGSPLRFWMADAVKEAAKNAVRHPNARKSTLHDWQCRAHVSRYDASGTEAALGWHPINAREELIQRGIVEAVAAGL